MQMGVRGVRVLKAFAGAFEASPRSARCDASSAVKPQVLAAFCRRVAVDASPLTRHVALVLASSSLLLGAAAPVLAQDGPSVTLGAGLRTTFVHTQGEDDDDEDSDESFDNFVVNNARLYVNGSVTKNVKFTLNTDFDSGTNEVRLLDAVGQISFSPAVNIWMGRFLPPSDRANLYGPFYAHSWGVFTDGIQDSYPMIYQGRLNGVAYWGEFNKLHLSFGVFDGGSGLSTGLDTSSAVAGSAGGFGGDDTTLISAGRIQYDFWDAESGYYQNSTYYGDKNILAIGLAGQSQGEDHSAWSADFLLERKVGMAGAYTVEAEWARYSQLGLTFPGSDTTDGGFVLGSYLFPSSGPGRWEVLGKFAQANLKGTGGPSESLRTSEANVSYILKQFNARFVFFFQNQTRDFNIADIEDDSSSFWKAGLGMQLQM